MLALTPPIVEYFALPTPYFCLIRAVGVSSDAQLDSCPDPTLSQGEYGLVNQVNYFLGVAHAFATRVI